VPEPRLVPAVAVALAVAAGGLATRRLARGRDAGRT
jgi:hypothetical protein